MRIIQEKISEHATLTGYIREMHQDFAHVSPFPAILVLPGGAFRAICPREGEPVAMAFYAKGFQAFVLDYTTVTKKPDAVMEDPMRDVETAMEWMKNHAEEYNINIEKIVLAGFSGGGHLAAAAATHLEKKPNALVLGYPGIVHSDLRALECPDIVERVDKTTPPSFLFSTRDDNVTPPIHALSFVQALEQAGGDFELHIFRSGEHGAAMGTVLTCCNEEALINPAFSQWFPLCITWLNAVLGLRC